MSNNIKMSRLQLKQLVKECLVEILQEGLNHSTSSSMNIKLPIDETRKFVERSSRISPLNMPVRSQKKQAGSIIQNSALANAVKANAGGNKLMENILADTAMTTLQSQIAGEIPINGNHNSGATSVGNAEQFVGTPEQVFGEDVTSKWADLAFMNVSSKKNA